MQDHETTSDVRAVLQIAAHFVSLKERATQFLCEFSANQRGHFTPTEDDQVRQLLVSYWHSRNALLELVTNRKKARLDVETQPMRFLAAFGGALVLIDAARFIRDEMHDRPVVRRKLNEPEPHFDIPGGCYDQIQKSLTRPAHAWHLYHANHHFEANAESLEQIASAESETQQLFDLVQRLRLRLDVSAKRFATARVRVRARALRTRVEGVVVGRAMYGLQKAVSQLVSDKYVKLNHSPQLPAAIVEEIETLLEPGDILVTRKAHAVTNYFLPGYWPHAALFVGDSARLCERQLDQHVNLIRHWDELLSIDEIQPRRVVESMKDGVRLRSLSVPLKCDAITILRPTLSSESLTEVIARAFFHVGKPYDFDFDFSRSDRLVCSEVVYRAFDGLDGTAFQLQKRAGRLTLAPEDLIRMALRGEFFNVVASYISTAADTLQTGDAAVASVKATLRD